MPRKRTSIPENYNAPLPTMLRELMSSSGYTQADLAAHLGITRQSVSAYMDGSANPAPATIVNIASFLGVSTDYLLGVSSYTREETAHLTAEEIGLSEGATTTLTELSKSSSSVAAKKIATLNLLLEDDGIDEWGSHLLHCIAEYLFAEPIPKQPLQFTSEGVKVLISEPDFLDPKQDASNFEYVDVLYDKLLIDRVTRATEDVRHQLRNPQTKSEK